MSSSHLCKAFSVSLQLFLYQCEIHCTVRYDCKSVQCIGVRSIMCIPDHIQWMGRPSLSSSCQQDRKHILKLSTTVSGSSTWICFFFAVKPHLFSSLHPSDHLSWHQVGRIPFLLQGLDYLSGSRSRPRVERWPRSCTRSDCLHFKCSRLGLKYVMSKKNVKRI